MSYETLRILWWLLLVALLTGFAVTDGFDLGVGAALRFIGRSDEERRALLAAVEPVWEGNQVWFILGGGAVFAAWPLLYAASFSGLYLAMFLVLVALILRPVGFAFRDQLPQPRWRTLWDWALTVGGLVPALLFGVAVGNLFRGLPFHFDALMRPVYTGAFLQLLHPFALLAGLVSLSMLVCHGATYAAMKVGQPMQGRAIAAGRAAVLVYVAGFLGAGAWLAGSLPGYHIVSRVTPSGPSNPLLKQVRLEPGAWLLNYERHAVLWLLPIVALVAAVAVWQSLGRGRAGAAFIASALLQAGTVATAAAALFPFLMPSSTSPDQGLTVWDASSSEGTLLIMFVAVLLFLPIVLLYTGWVFRVLRGRITLETLHRHSGL